VVQKSDRQQRGQPGLIVGPDGACYPARMFTRHEHAPFLPVSFFTFIFLDRHSILRFAVAHYYWHFIQ
jgi:hypothetical protein